jgi:pentatricopeptide repeat protein
LLNSYIAVLSAHCRSSQVVERISEVVIGTKENPKSLFEETGTSVNGYTCFTVIDACGMMEHSPDTYHLACEMWQRWLSLVENATYHRENPLKAKGIGLDSRTISDCWSAMIRLHAKYNQVDEAMKLVREFARLYPPASLFNSLTFEPSSPSSSSLSPRKGIQGTSPLFSSTSLTHPIRGRDISRIQNTMSQDPTLQFRAVQILHLRLVELETRPKDLAYLSWLLKSYEHQLQPKKPKSLQGDLFTSRQAAYNRIVQQRTSSR